MSNLSQQKRMEMLDYLEQLKAIHTDDESQIALLKIQTALTEKKYGLVWEEHEEEVNKMLLHNIPVFIENSEKKVVASSCRTNNKYSCKYGKCEYISLRNLEKICIALKCTPDDIIEFMEKTNG